MILFLNYLYRLLPDEQPEEENELTTVMRLLVSEMQVNNLSIMYLIII